MRLEQSTKLAFSLFDISGKDLGRFAKSVFQSGENEFIPNVSGLSKGVYVIRIVSEAGVQAIKFVLD
ncbi:MAG: T9SS type A sorting domain-containing protein [Bacteroidetes bacterium]|nr:T9SS type A sorting domain-containing protein [Bacteroidota bacterium]